MTHLARPHALPTGAHTDDELATMFRDGVLINFEAFEKLGASPPLPPPAHPWAWRRGALRRAGSRCSAARLQRLGLASAN